MADAEDLDARLRDHLQRVAEHPPRGDFEERLLAAAINPGSRLRKESRVEWNRLGVLLAVAALVVVMVMAFAGHESSNVFTNISNGLNTN
jgi:hypothetical protein